MGKEYIVFQTKEYILELGPEVCKALEKGRFQKKAFKEGFQRNNAKNVSIDTRLLDDSKVPKRYVNQLLFRFISLWAF